MCTVKYITTRILVGQEVHRLSIGNDMHVHSDTSPGPNLP